MTDIERLRSDMEVFQRYQGYSIMENALADLAEKIARLEAEADPWRAAKEIARSWAADYHGSNTHKTMSHYIAHLTVKIEAYERQLDGLKKRVAKMETEDPRVLRRALDLMERLWLQGIGLRNPKCYIEKARKEFESESGE